MRGTDDHAEIAAQTLRHVGDARRRQWPNEFDVNASGNKARFQCTLKQVTGNAGVLANQHRAAPLWGQHACGGTGEAQGEIHRHRVFAYSPTHAIGTEISSCHCLLLSARRLAGSPHGRRPFNGVHCSAHIVRAHDESTRAHRQRRRRHPGGEPIAHSPPGDAAQH